jgi:hypothetical protein
VLDGSEEQSWTDAGLGLADQIFDWHTKLQHVAWSEAHHKYTLLHSYNTTTAGNVYGLASMLLVAGGWSSYSSNNRASSPEAWRAIFGRARRLGAPAGRYFQLRNRVYARRFRHGIVLVNPTAAQIRRFRLPGRYVSAAGVPLRSVRMGPTSGLILPSGR